MKSSVSKRPYVMAVVIGTALSVYAAPGQAAATQTPSATAQAIADMSRYCVTCWRNARLPADCWTDCTQEVFRRLLERMPADAWDQVLRGEGEERREFLRAIDTVKKRSQRQRKFSPAIDNVADARDSYRRDLRDEREVVRQAAAEVLTPRQQRILQLSFEGWSVQDTAEKLQLPVERISDEKYKAIRKLRTHLLG
ncbi:MAG TPA: sigma-70 family RNA polymerase sigma factor [Gemmataceae bacterium]|nr:sigma-70 family RNA polymerase sigma factor [Gemmataceae bacterium]